MSQENVEIVREMLEAFDRGDRVTWLSFHDEDHVVITSDTWPEAGDIHGREGAWDFYIGVADVFDERGFASAELQAVGPNKVLTHHANTVHGRASGAVVELDYWVVATFRNGKVVRDEWFADQGEALKAAGLSE